MIGNLPERKHIFAILAGLSWMVIFCISLLPDMPIPVTWVIGFGPALILAWYLFFDPEVFLYLTIFFVPLSVGIRIGGGAVVSFPSEVMAVLMLIYMAVNFSILRIPDRRIFRHPIFIILLIYLSWFLICSLNSELQTVSLKRTIAQCLFFVVFYCLFLFKFDKTVNILRFYLFYALGLIIPVINGIIWHAGYSFNPQASYYMPQPFFIEHTVYGAALAFVIPALYYIAFIRNQPAGSRLKKYGLILLFLFILFAEFLAFSRAAWLSILVLPLFILVLNLRLPQGLLLGGLLVLLILFQLNLNNVLKFMSHNEAQSNRGNLKEQIESVSNIRSDISNLERINRWKSAIRMFHEKPLTGFGPGTYQFIYGRYQVRSEMTRISTYHGEKGNAHSEYLGLLAETGWPGLLIYLSLVLAVVSTATKVIYRSGSAETRNLSLAVLLSLLTFFLHTVFNGFIETDKIGSLFFGSLAAVTALDVYFYRRNRV